MRFRAAVRFTTAGAALLAAGCASGRASGGAEMMMAHDRTAAGEFAARVDSLRRAGHIPGLAVVVLRDTTVLLARGFGLADVERGIPVTPETPFDIASVSKPVSAVVALRLAEQKVLDTGRCGGTGASRNSARTCARRAASSSPTTRARGTSSPCATFSP